MSNYEKESDQSCLLQEITNHFSEACITYCKMSKIQRAKKYKQSLLRHVANKSGHRVGRDNVHHMGHLGRIRQLVEIIRKRLHHILLLAGARGEQNSDNGERAE